MGIDQNGISKTLYHLMMGYAAAEDVTIPSDLPFLMTLPSSTELFRVELELKSGAGREKLLRYSLQKLKEQYDYIVIDSPPAMSLLAVNAIIAADFLLIPLQCDFYAMEALGPFLKMVRVLKQKYNPDMKMMGILLTMFEERERISRKIEESIRWQLKSMVFQTIIPRSVQLRESSFYGKPLILLDIMSLGARSYLALAREIIARDGRNGDRNSNRPVPAPANGGP